MRKVLSFTWLAAAAIGCGGVSSPPGPRLIDGGGVGDGKISGALHVYVIDNETHAVISSASVRVGASSDPAACTLLTDSTGLADFDSKVCPGLKGPVTVTASAQGYAPTTWIGVNAVNLTMDVRNTNPPPVDMATVSGTIAGWDSLPVPPANHQTLALVGYSQSPTLGDRANNITQGMRTIVVGSQSPMIMSNLCVLNASVSDCNWSMQARTGFQAHYALIVDHYNNMTPNDDTDDTFTVTGWAILRGITLVKGDNINGEVLKMIPDSDAQSFTVSFAALPSGMNYLGAFPALELGQMGWEGRIPLVAPALDLTHTTTRVPKAIGDLSDMTYSLIAQAQDAKDTKRPASLAWLHNVDVSKTVQLTSWLAAPSAISTANGTFSFSAVPGATIQQGEIQDANGNRLWSVTLFDGSTSFTLPGLSPDPLPTGTLTFEASALLVPGIDLGNFTVYDVQDKITGIAQDDVTYTR
ncbi:MAG TPA: hypothetical protein VKQ32_03335 [Polyangia bacterium]|nr:hypothetical protein [Polyangia bacterium]